MTNVPILTDAETQKQRQDFYTRIGEHSMTPLWESLHALVLKQPASPALPHLWRYDDMARPFLTEAGQLITAREAERRVLILENPGIKGGSSITRSLYAGLQMVLPGDVAPAHRHTQNALRFIVEGAMAYTAVNGERTLMHPGDLVLTPAWHWHDHGNDSDMPMVWLDALDIPMVAFFDASFSETGNEDSQTVVRPTGDSDRRFGNNLAPVDWQPATQSSPIFNYPYARTLETLQSMAQGDVPDPCHGHKLRYVNPASGGHVTPTMAAFMQHASCRFHHPALPINRRHGFLGRRRRRGKRHRRAEIPLEGPRCLRRAELDRSNTPCRRGRCAVQLLRSRRTGKTRVMARAAQSSLNLND